MLINPRRACTAVGLCICESVCYHAIAATSFVYGPKVRYQRLVHDDF